MGVLLSSDRRSLLQAALATLASGPAWARAPLKPRARPERLLIAFAAGGGASVLDSFLPLLESEAPAQLRTYKREQMEADASSAFRTVKALPYSLGVPVNTSYQMSDFLHRHGRDTLLVTQTGTSVNHLLAAQRSLNGNGANRNRTLMEAVAAAYGEGHLLANVNMGFAGYALPGSDSSLPRFARPEAIADALLFPLALHRDQRLGAAAPRELLEAARRVRDELDAGFAADHARSSALQSFVQNRAAIGPIEAAELLEALMLLDQVRLRRNASLGSRDNALLLKVRQSFPAYQEDPLEAQAAMTFLLFRYGLSCSVTFGLDDLVRFQGQGEQKEILHLPLAFDWSHNNHQGAQNSMWRRVLSTLDRLISLLKSEFYLGDPALGTIWERSCVYIASEFGRDRENRTGSGHHLNNGSVIISPLLLGNKIYGGLDPLTGLTYGFDPQTGEPDRTRQTSEAEVYSLILQGLGISFEGQTRFPCLAV